MADAMKVIAILQSRIGALEVELAAMQSERDDALTANAQPVTELHAVPDEPLAE